MKLEAVVEAEINKRENELAADASVDTETPKEG